MSGHMYACMYVHMYVCNIYSCTHEQDEKEADACFVSGHVALNREAHDSLLTFLAGQLVK